MRTLTLAFTLLAMLTLSGCIAGNDDSPTTDDAAAAAEGTNETALVLYEHSGSTGNAIATPAISVNNGGAYEFEVDRTSANITGYVLELTWEAGSPASENLDLWIRETGNFAIDPTNPELVNNALDSQPHMKATGASPLRLTFTPDELDPEAEYSMLVRAASPAGASLDQSFTLNVAVFDGIEFDPEHAF